MKVSERKNKQVTNERVRNFLRGFALWLCCLMSVSAFSKDAEINGVDGKLTMQSPSFSFKLLMCDDDSNKAYWTGQPSLYINGNYVCKLEIPTGNGGDYYGVATNYTDKDWKTYETSDYYVVLKNPYRYMYESIDGLFIHYDSYYYYWVTVEILPKKIKVGGTYEAKVSGKWCTNNTGGSTKDVSLTYTGVADESVFNETAERTLSRPENKIMQYNQKVLRTYSNYYYRFDFYHDSNYNRLSHSRTLEKSASSTGSAVRWTESNTEDRTYYLRQAIVNESASYGISKTGRVEWSQNFGSLSSKGFCYPKNLVTEAGERWDKLVALSWDINKTQSNSSHAGYWHIYRLEGNDVGGSPSENRKEVGKVKMVPGTDNYQFTDKSKELAYDVPYTYEVIFFPDEWNRKDPDACDGLSVYSKEVTSISRGGDLFKEFQVNSHETSVELNWETESFSENNKYKFTVYRADTNSVDAAFVELTNVTVVDKNQVNYTYSDKNLESPCDLYYYKVVVEALDTIFSTEIKSGRLAQTSYVSTLKASYGEYSDMVRLRWDVKQIGSEPTNFVLYRRLLSDRNSSWNQIYTTAGTDAAYAYEDMAVTPGEYYEYKVESYCLCEGKTIAPVAQTTDGFSVARGVVSGRITYATGTSVPNVKVKAVAVSGNDYAPINQQFYSLNVKNVKGGIHLNLNNDEAKLSKLHTEGDFSVQMWVNLNDTLAGKPMWLDVYNNFSLFAKPIANAEADSAISYQLVLRVPASGNQAVQDKETDIYFAPHTFYHTTLTYSAANKRWTVYVMRNKELMDSVEVVATRDVDLKEIIADRMGIAFGTNVSNMESYLFKGYIDEVRWWNRELTLDDIKRNHDHLLDGTENGLVIYYPLDENIPNQNKAYDYSASGLHGSILPDSKLSIITPRGKQFGLHTYTDESGNYTLRGIPFASNGTTYDIIPELGVHKFSTEKEPRFISKTSLVHNDVDFKDVSSFKVEGVVYYENTLHPVSGCAVLIDGEPTMYDERIVQTDAEGRFTISVPIGDHYISVEKDGHVFKNAGRYPADEDSTGITHTFDREISGLKFTDVTKATVVGRVSGGPVQASTALGMGKGKANLGQAIITLIPESDARMNVLEDKSADLTSEVVNNPDSAFYENPFDERIKSSSWVCGGNNNAVKTIKIRTDAKNGEFAALLPPVNYKVVSVEIPGYGENDNFFKENLPRLEADGLIEKESIHNEVQKVPDTERDTVVSDTCYYHAALVLNYRSTPCLEITDSAHIDGAFGEVSAMYVATDGQEKSQSLYTVDEKTGAVNYTYLYPIIQMSTPYTYQLKAFEKYVNKDRDAETDTLDVVPLEGVNVKIYNNFSGGTVVVGAKNSVSGDAGEVLKTDVAEVVLDSAGVGMYKFIGGLPNIQGDHTLAMTATYEVDGVTYSWREANNPFKAIVLGSLPYGNNFVTKGPDKVSAVLRDPPGSNSYSMWETGQVIETEERDNGKYVAYDSGLDLYFAHGYGQTVAMGAPGAYTVNEANVVNDITVGVLGNTEIVHGNVRRTKKTLTQTISTSDSPDFVGADGDVFVGESTNLIFGDARNLGLYASEDSTASLALKDVVTMGDSISTYFVYTQYHIKNILIPNLRKISNSLIKTVGTAVNADTITTPVYVSKVAESHPLYGTSNSDPRWKELAADKFSTDGPSYTVYFPRGASNSDMVKSYNEQIEQWEKILADNEEAKYEAIQGNSANYELHKNVSFGGGVFYEDFYQYDHTDEDKSKYLTCDFDVLFHFESNVGFLFNDKLGFTFSPQLKLGGGGDLSDIKDHYERLTTKYVLADNNYTDAYSVDVYKSPDNDGLIFYTRGGQTSCPYEGAVKSVYYKNSENRPVDLGNATTPVEVPEITCANAMQTGIPAGDKAYFELELRNNSGVNADTWYDLSVVEESNPHGAELLVDGLGVARSYMIQAGKSVKKTITLKQGDPSIFDYENIKIRLSSQCQGDPTAPNGEISDTISLSAYFVQTCSNIRLNIAHPVLNSATGANLTIVVDDYNLNHDNLQGIVLEYQVQGDVDWTQLKKYVTNQKYVVQDESLLTEAKITYTFNMEHMPDQNYVFRARTLCGSNVYNESEEIVVIKDMVKPTLIGMPSPTDGIYNVGDEIAIVFAEDVRSGEIKQENITVKAVLNETPVDHQVAFQSDGTSMAATDATFDAKNRSFAIGLWMNYSTPGSIVCHGTQDNNLRVLLNKDHALEVYIGADTLVSEAKLRPNTWIYLHVALCQAADDYALTAVAAMNDEVLHLFDSKPCSAYSGNGRLALGGTMVGAIHEVTFWNNDRSSDDALSQMYATHAPHAMGLIGYWKMNEGTGTLAKDYARNRHMTLPSSASWYVSNENYSLHLPDNGFADVPLYSAPMTAADDYLLEFWFKADKEKAQADATLFSVGDSLLEVTLKQGAVELLHGKNSSKLSIANKFDAKWHHFALNVLNGTKGGATLYIDGEAVRQFAAKEIPALAANYLHLGAKGIEVSADQTTYSQPFPQAAFDELRLWKGTHTAGFIRENMHKRVVAAADGLMAYYPFERSSLDEYNQAVTMPCETNQSKQGLTDTVRVRKLEGTPVDFVSVASNADVPALAAAPLQQNVPFSFTVSERKILIQPEADARVMEGTTLTVSVKGVVDAHDNECDPVSWTAYVQQNPLVWSEDSYTIRKKAGEAHHFSLDISNVGAATEHWTLSQLPEWLEVDNETGSLLPGESKTLHFTLNDAIAIGRHEAIIYLSGTYGVLTPLELQVAVVGNEPDWQVNPADYPNSMMLIARLKIMNEFSENPDNLIGAFTGDGSCVGVARLEYVKRYDAYYVMMNIYGDKDGYNLIFKAYDADRGIVHHSLITQLDTDDANTNSTISFTSNGVVGTFDNPVLLHATGHVEQTIPLNDGWTWMSVNVMKPQDSSVATVLKPLGDKGIVVKGKDGFADYTPGSGWVGELTDIVPGNMYKLKTTEECTLPVVGFANSADTYPIQVVPGWNWIGYTPQASTSVANALANMNPQHGDIVKSQYAFAVFADYQWEGTLKAMHPGEGYAIYSSASYPRTFYYPNVMIYNTQMRTQHLSRRSEVQHTGAKYADNMNVIAVVRDGEHIVGEAQVLAYVDGEQRGYSAASLKDGKHFITIQGEGVGSKLHFVVKIGDELIPVADPLLFGANTICGSVADPYVLQIDPAMQAADIRLTRSNHLLTIVASAGLQSVKVYDAEGRVVHETVADGQSVQHSIAHYTNGVYLIVAEDQMGCRRTFCIVK